MNYEKITTECLEEMFARVGLTYPDDSLTKQDNWFKQYTWTQAEDDAFKEWMIKKLKRHRMLRPEMETAMFMLMWGWAIEDEKEIV